MLKRAINNKAFLESDRVMAGNAEDCKNFCKLPTRPGDKSPLPYAPDPVSYTHSMRLLEKKKISIELGRKVARNLSTSYLCGVVRFLYGTMGFKSIAAFY